MTYENILFDNPFCDYSLYGYKSTFCTKTEALQYASEGIRVNSLHPGELDTPLARSAMADIVNDDPDFEDPRLNWIPLGRLGKAIDIANLVLYLASDESTYVTGSEFVIDGGWTVW